MHSLLTNPKLHILLTTYHRLLYLHLARLFFNQTLHFLHLLTVKSVFALKFTLSYSGYTNMPYSSPSNTNFVCQIAEEKMPAALFDCVHRYDRFLIKKRHCSHLFFRPTYPTRTNLSTILTAFI